MNRLVKTFTLWLWGGFIYYMIEVTARGASHPSMFVVGGLCLVIVGGINNWLPWEMGLVQQSLIGAAVITLVEFVSGCILNLWLGWKIWDYSDQPGNILGQICVLFCAVWIVMAFIGILIDDFLRHKIYGEEKPRYSLV